MTVEVLVKLAARDPWSFTVLDALRNKFGIEALDGVQRLKSWRLDFDVESEEKALGLAGSILDQTALLANPNRDVWAARCISRPLVPETFLGVPVADGRTFAVRVTDREDIIGKSMGALLRRRLGLAQVRGVVYSLIWFLRFRASPDASRGLAEEIAVARSWRKGLLANPHCQEAAVCRIEEFPGMETNCR
jgi:phosphoribosylformylglycinamidine (FGAM) synthase PurS component